MLGETRLKKGHKLKGDQGGRWPFAGRRARRGVREKLYAVKNFRMGYGRMLGEDHGGRISHAGKDQGGTRSYAGMGPGWEKALCW